MIDDRQPNPKLETQQSLTRTDLAPSSPVPDQPYSVELHIDEVVLYGFAEGRQVRIGESLSRVLSGLLSEYGSMPSPDQNRELEALDGGSFEITAQSSDEIIGSQIAHALYRKLKGRE